MITQEDIIAANRASAADQVEQDERNEALKAEMRADGLVNRPAPHHPRYFRENAKEEFLAEIVKENLNQSQCKN
jgi:hypothetical protein